MTQPPGISDMLGVTELPAEWRYNTLFVAYFSSYDIYIHFLWCHSGRQSLVQHNIHCV